MNNQQTNMDNSLSYKDIIEKNKMLIAAPVGTSMMPMIRQGLDTVLLIKPEGRCKKNDVILYQRADGTYVLHRIIKVKKNEYYLCGDNQVRLEKKITDNMIIGVMQGFYRQELYVDAKDEKYLKYVHKTVRKRKFKYCKWIIKKILSKLGIK